MQLQQKSQMAFVISGIGFVVLLLLIMLSTMWLVPTHKSPNIVVCILALIPLVILLPWLWKKNVRSFIWLCFILLGYFLTAVQNCFISQYGWLPFVEVAVIVNLFISAMLFARWQKQVERQ